jgi:hypothetical protein
MSAKKRMMELFAVCKEIKKAKILGGQVTSEIAACILTQ